MARQEHERENLMRDARALVRRAEIAWRPDAPHLVLGRHSSGAASFYFGEDPVYHFNSAGQLRRAYVGGRLYKAENGRLVEIDRARVPGQVELRSRPLTPEQLTAFLAAAHKLLSDVAAHVDQRQFKLVAECPDDSQVVPELVDWMRAGLAGPLVVAQRPHVG